MPRPLPDWLIAARKRERAIVRLGRRRALTVVERDELNALRIKMNGPDGIRHRRERRKKPDAPLGQIPYSGTVRGGLPGLGKR